MTDRILLVGMMGSGKTTAGRALAERLSCAHFDSDEQVERRTGRTVAQIFAEEGEAAFRGEEKRALADALSHEGPAVVSVAGGAVLDPENRRQLRHAGLVVWLRAEVDTLAQRVGEGGHRPLLGDDARAALARLYEQRRPVYEQVAHVVIDVDGLPPERIVDGILLHVGSAELGAP